MELSPLKPRPLTAFEDEALDADLASILRDRGGGESPLQRPLQWLNDWWHRPEIVRIWGPAPTWRDDLKWYAVALLLLQLILIISLLLRDASLADDFGTLASLLGV